MPLQIINIEFFLEISWIMEQNRFCSKSEMVTRDNTLLVACRGNEGPINGGVS
jgi:hypothetical protein